MKKWWFWNKVKVCFYYFYVYIRIIIFRDRNIVFFSQRNRYIRHLVGFKRYARLMLPDSKLRKLVIPKDMKQVQEYGCCKVGKHLLLWNDEVEWESIKAKNKLTFFNSVLVNTGDLNGKIVKLGIENIGILTKEKINNKIVFAGNVDSEIYINLFRKSEREKASNIVSELSGDFSCYRNLFDLRSDLFLGIDGLQNRVCFRHLIINLFRESVLKNIAQEFEDEVCFHIYGSGRHKIPKAKNFISEIKLLDLYASAKCNLDLGSGSGLAWLYPRSAEIMSTSPYLCQIKLPGSEVYFSGPKINHVFLNVNDALLKIKGIIECSSNGDLFKWHHNSVHKLNLEAVRFNRCL